VDSRQGVGLLRRLNRSTKHRDGRGEAFADHVFTDWAVVIANAWPLLSVYPGLAEALSPF
jgi:hypothetical protein